MAHRVLVAPSAARHLKKLNSKNPSQLEDIRNKIDELSVDPRPPGCEKLKGYENLYRVRFGDYRIVYHIADLQLVVLVLKVGNRREVYERIRQEDLTHLRGMLADLAD